MIEDDHPDRTWIEDNYSRFLYRHINRLCADHAPQLRATFNSPYEPKQCLRTPRTAMTEPHPDIQVALVGSDEEETAFCWEAKIVKPGSAAAARYLEDYRDDGMEDRYITGKYAWDRDSGGMLGFVLGGAVQEIVDRLNPLIQVAHWSRDDADLLSPDRTVPGVETLFASHHERPNHGPIDLSHLFLCFNLPGPRRLSELELQRGKDAITPKAAIVPDPRARHRWCAWTDVVVMFIAARYAGCATIPQVRQWFSDNAAALRASRLWSAVKLPGRKTVEQAFEGVAGSVLDELVEEFGLMQPAAANPIQLVDAV
jgi:hypothetical protein